MNLIALFLGLVLERLATRLLPLREVRWLDGWFDIGIALMRKSPAVVSWLVAALVVVIPALPVAAVGIYFGHTVSGALYILFAAVVLVFSLGPRDLMEQVDEYLAAVEGDHPESADALARSLLEGKSVAGDNAAGLESAVVVQANHRVFGVLLWFMLLGPAGGWGFRVADLFRRRSVFESARTGQSAPVQIQEVFELVAWLPARLLALTYAVAGSFEDAAEDWRRYYRDTSGRFLRASEEVVAVAGVGAIRRRCPAGDTPGRVRAAAKLVRRSVVIWVTVISLATLVGVAA